jgi:hypothetical protein
MGNRSSETAVFSFGCPRSGTTFIQSVLNAGDGYHYNKIGEGDRLHPCNSRDGLINLCQLYRRRGVLFVRTVRDPVAIFNSFYGARHLVSTHQTHGLSLYGIANNDDERIYKFIESERDSVKEQMSDAYGPTPSRPSIQSRVITVEYEKLSDQEYRDNLYETLIMSIHSIRLIKNKDSTIPLKNALDNFGKHSVRDGLMNHGMGDEMFLSPEKIEEIRCRLG